MSSIAVIGAGRWGSNWIRTLAGLPDAELRWVCDVNTDSLQRIKQTYPRVRTTARLEDLLEDHTLAGVVIATVAPMHFDITRRNLQAGKHVLVEKPMTLAAHEGVELTGLAHAHRRVLMVGHLLEYHPAIRRLQALISAGELGEVAMLYQQRLNLGTLRSDENAWWSLAPHDISVANRLFGQTPVSVQCRGQCVIQPGIADTVFGVLAYPGGKLAQLHVSWLDPTKSRRLVVVGTKRMAILDDAAEHKLTLFDKGFDRRQGIVARNGEATYPNFDRTEPLVLEAEHFLECIRTGRRPISDGESGVSVVAVLECGQRSMDQGGAVIAIPSAVADLRQSA